MVCKLWATESLTKRTITLKKNVVLPNYIAGGMDAVENAFVWNFTKRECGKGGEELEELYNGQLVLIPSDGGHMLGSVVAANDPRRGQRAWLKIGRGTTVAAER
jgi:hypothetical protein